MPGNLTPLLLTAMQGFLDNNSLAINSDFLDEIAIYRQQPLVEAYRSFIGTASLTDDILIAIPPVFADYPYLIDALIDGTPTCSSTAFFTDYLIEWSNSILATSQSNSHAKFIQTFQIAMSYVNQMNDTVNSAVNGADVGASTFTSMDEILSGNLTLVSSSTKAFGKDLLKTGNFLDFQNLSSYGTPHFLLKSLIQTNALGLLKNEFENIGINIGELTETVLNSSIPVSLEIQKTIYVLAQEITDKKLSDILLMMSVETEDLETLADLIDTRKLFPSSKLFLNTINGNTLERIYLDNGISNYTNSLTTIQISVMPSDIAKSNLALRNAFYQIKNITSIKTAALAEQFNNIEINEGLTNIASFETALPASVTIGLQDHLAKGQSTDGTFYVTDAVGTPCGTTHTASLIEFNKYHDGLNSAKVTEIINKLSEIVSTAQEAEAEYILANPDMEIPGWEAGRIAAINSAVSPVITELADLVLELIQLSPPPTDVPTGYFASLKQVETEVFTLNEAVDWPSSLGTTFDAGLGRGLCGGLDNQMSPAAAKKVILGFTESLHSLSEKTDLHNAVEVLEKLAIGNTGGEAIIAAMREGRNLIKLDKAGVKTDTKIDNQTKTAS